MVDIITQIYDTARTFGLAAFTFILFYSAYQHFFASDPMTRKNAWETLSYALVGALLILIAPELSRLLS